MLPRKEYISLVLWQ